ncbi:MAG: VWA domain-containing protein [Polyangiaceae bacterium]
MSSQGPSEQGSRAAATGPASKRGGAAPPRRGRGRVWLTRIAWLVFVAALTAALIYAYRKYVWHMPDPTYAFKYKGIDYEILNPRLIGLFLVFPLFVIVLPLSLADLPWPQRILSVLLRGAFVALIAMSLTRLAKTSTQSKVCTVYLIDVSNSVPDEALSDAHAAIEQALKDKPEDGLIKIITFARRPRVIDIAEDGTFAIERHGDAKAGNPNDEGAGSNLQAALQLGYGLYPPGYLKRAVLFSDGVQTDGDLLAEANRTKELGIALYTVPYTRPVPGEVAVQELKMPDHIKVGETFEVRGILYASRATVARARLYAGAYLNGLDGVRQLELKAGLNDVVFKSVVHEPGPITYALELDQIRDDRFTDNNRAEIAVDVPGRAQVLLVDSTPDQASYLARALVAQQFEVDLRPPVGFPRSLPEMEKYDFVIVSDVAKDQLEMSSQDLIERYVRDLGGGFLFAGGENGYALGGWFRSTMERILPVKMEPKDEKEMPSVAMALVLDRSGSMTGLPIEMAKAAAKATVETLAPDDLIEVIAFDSSPQRFVKLQPARNRSRINADIARIQPAGGTEIFSALDAAFQDMTVALARRKHVILLTDGRAPTTGIKELVQAMAAESITITTVGLGTELDEQLLRMIAELGGGRFHSVPDPNNLPKIFTAETEMISRDAAKEEWFPVVQTGDAQFLKGLAVETSPFLHGYVETQLKPAPAEQILASETGDPILARWHVGLGWTLAWTSDVKARWSVEWLKWPGFEQFWGQLVREHMRVKHTRVLDMKAEMINGTLHASVDAFTPDDQFENGLTSSLKISRPIPAEKASAAKEKPKLDEQTVELRQVAPGRYEANVPLDKFGSFLLKAEHFRTAADGTKKLLAVSYGQVSNPYPREYASFEPNKVLLDRAAQVGGGKMNAKIEEIFDPRGEKMTYHEQLWSKFLYLAIGIFLLDLFVRRVRLFDRKFVAKTRRA